MKFSVEFVQQIADLAKLTIDEAQAKDLALGFEESMAVVEELSQVPTQGLEPTYQVNNLVNVWREDVVNKKQMFTQKQALANAKNTYRGYLVVERIIDHET